MKRLVKWESWIDPLNSNLDEVEWPGFNLDEDGDEIPCALTQAGCSCSNIKNVQCGQGIQSCRSEEMHEGDPRKGRMAQ